MVVTELEALPLTGEDLCSGRKLNKYIFLRAFVLQMVIETLYMENEGDLLLPSSTEWSCASLDNARPIYPSGRYGSGGYCIAIHDTLLR